MSQRQSSLRELEQREATVRSLTNKYFSEGLPYPEAHARACTEVFGENTTKERPE